MIDATEVVRLAAPPGVEVDVVRVEAVPETTAAETNFVRADEISWIMNEEVDAARVKVLLLLIELVNNVSRVDEGPMTTIVEVGVEGRVRDLTLDEAPPRLREILAVLVVAWTVVKPPGAEVDVVRVEAVPETTAAETNFVRADEISWIMNEEVDAARVKVLLLLIELVNNVSRVDEGPMTTIVEVGVEGRVRVVKVVTLDEEPPTLWEILAVLVVAWTVVTVTKGRIEEGPLETLFKTVSSYALIPVQEGISVRLYDEPRRISSAGVM